jgi:hypothetical protein
MSSLDSFHIITSTNPFVLILCLVLLIAFAFYIYKYTLPKVSGALRITLIVIRSSILVLILFIIFEPVLSLSYRRDVETKTYLFIDNSNSIAAKDSSQRLEQMLLLENKIESTVGNKLKLFSFGKKIDSLKTDEVNKINLSKQPTNFTEIVELIRKKSDEISSAIIVSDGIINDGVDPIYQAEKLQSPIFTIGIGDSTEKKDVSIHNVLFNQYIYANKPTTIEVSVKNTGFANQNARLTFYEENKVIESKDVLLGETGLNKVAFTYKPTSGGEKKLSVNISGLKGEATYSNNSRIFYINVLDTKLKVALVAGSPSKDVSSISDALSTDKNIQVRKLIQISANKFWNDAQPSLIDSSDILFLVDFPSATTPQQLLNKISYAVYEQSKPFFIMVTNRVNYGRLNALDKALPFSIDKVTSELVQTQPEILSDVYASNFSTDNNKSDIWNNLPPVTQMNAQFPIKAGTNVLVRSKVRNFPVSNPLIVTKSIGRQRSFAILAGDIWRWQLQSAEKNPLFFVNFINDIVKWLNVSSQKKQFTVITDKKTYSPGEQINFTASLYDQTFAAIDTSKIEMVISQNENKFNLSFTPLGNGLYSAEYSATTSGDYRFEANAKFNGSSIKSDVGRFSVNEAKIEKTDTRMRPEFLSALAKSTNGEYYSIDNYSALLTKLAEINSFPFKEVFSKSELQLWSDKWMLVAIIILFAAEWFLRKRSGML